MTTESEVRDVSFEDAVAEEHGEPSARPAPGPQPTPETAPVPPQSIDQTQVTPEPPPVDSENQKSQAEEDIEVIVPKHQAKEWSFGPQDHKRAYIQEQLSVIGEIQWFALLGEFLDKSMSGDSAISLNAILSPPTPRQPGQFQLQDLQDADTFVLALGKLLVFMPEFMEKSICIWLAVPDYEWELVREYMKLSPTRGGMSHDMFEEIVAIFIDQNYGAIDRFFRERYPRLRARFQARAQEASRSRSSKR